MVSASPDHHLGFVKIPCFTCTYGSVPAKLMVRRAVEVQQGRVVQWHLLASKTEAAMCTRCCSAPITPGDGQPARPSHCNRINPPTEPAPPANRSHRNRISRIFSVPTGAAQCRTSRIVRARGALAKNPGCPPSALLATLRAQGLVCLSVYPASCELGGPFRMGRDERDRVPLGHFGQQSQEQSQSGRRCGRVLGAVTEWP